MYEYLIDPEKMATIHAKLQNAKVAAQVVFYVALGAAALIFAMRI